MLLAYRCFVQIVNLHLEVAKKRSHSKELQYVFILYIFQEAQKQRKADLYFLRLCSRMLCSFPHISVGQKANTSLNTNNIRWKPSYLMKDQIG